MQEKILSYIGFARKAGKVRLGVNAITTLKGEIPLMILCSTASENTKKDAISLSKKYNSALIISKEYTVEDIFSKENCKLAAILDKELAKAILYNLNEKFVQFGG